MDDTAQKLVEENELKSGEYEKYGVKKNPEFGKRYAEYVCVRARRDDITTTKYIADERRTTYLMFRKIRRICHPPEGEKQDKHHPDTFHITRILALSPLRK